MRLTKTTISLGVLAAAAIMAGGVFSGCKKDRPSKDDVEGVITELPTGFMIAEGDYADLRRAYADSHQVDGQPDTTGFYEYLWGMLEKLGYDSSTITVAVPSEEVVETVAALPLQVSFYLDNSSSMKGYLNPGGGMTISGIVDVVNGINGFYNETQNDSAYYVSAKGLKGVDYKTFTSDLTSKKTGYSDAFLLDEFLAKIVTNAVNDSAHNRIAFFITDGIPSGTNAEIAKDRMYNINNRSTLEGRIAAAVGKAKSKNYGASVYQFNADFDGDYYDYSNKRTKISKGVRPFYVVVIGERELVSRFAKNADSKNIPNFVPVNSVHMISPVQDLSPTIADLDLEKSSGDLYVINPNEDVDNKTVVKVVFPFDQLPEYLRDEEALRNAFHVKVDGAEFDGSRFQFNEGKELILPIPMTNNSQKKVEIVVENAMPGWVTVSTSRDDSQINTQLNQTFLLDALINGLKNGVYGTNTNNLASKTFTLDWNF